MSTSDTTGTSGPADALPDYAPVPESSFGPALNEQGYHVGRVERNLYWVTDGVYQAAFLTTQDGVVLFDAPPSIGHNLQRAIDEIARSQRREQQGDLPGPHPPPRGPWGRILALRQGRRADRARGDPAAPAPGRRPGPPAPEETFSDRRTLEIGGERIELAWHGANHTPDNSVIHFPEHDALMMVDIVNVGWVPVYVVNLSDDIPGYLGMPATALTYPWKTLISGHLGRLGTREDVVCTSSTWRTSRPAPGSPSIPSIRRPTSRSRRERLGRRQGLPRRGRRRDGRSGHREVHRRAGSRGRVHPGRRVLAHGVDPAQPRLRLAGAPMSAVDAAAAKGRSSVSTEQRETLDAILRQSAFPPDSDVDEQRRLLRELLSAQPLPADVTVTAAALGGVPTAEITVDGIEPRHIVLYFHGGVYVIGDAFLAADLASQVGRRTARQGHLRRLPARPRAPVSGRGRRRSGRLRSPPARRHSPIGHRLRGRVRRRRARHRHPGQRPRSRAAPARRGLRHVTVCRPHPGRGDHGNQARGRPAAQPASTPSPGHRLYGGARCRSRPDQPDLRRPVRPAAPDHPGRNARGSPRRRHPPRPASRHRRRRGHPRHHPRGAPRLPGLSPDPRRSGRGAGQSRTAPVGASASAERVNA